MQHRFKAKHAGFSLIELLLVLGVLAILLIAAFVVYPQVRDRNQINQELTNLTAIKANVSSLYASRRNYESLNTGIANQARVFPSSINGGDYRDGAGLTPSWGGSIGIGPYPVAIGGYGANGTYMISYTDVPQSVCLGFLSGAAPNFLRMSVNGKRVLDLPEGERFDVGAAAEACQNSDTLGIIAITN